MSDCVKAGYYTAAYAGGSGFAGSTAYFGAALVCGIVHGHRSTGDVFHGTIKSVFLCCM